MNDTGIVRHIDDLGRIVLPMELRRTLGIHVKDPISISVDGERIVLQKHRDSCAICGGSGETVRVNDRAICLDCVALVKRI
jgi:transcriptional pleiotropic regulator of transition state genes